MTLKEFIDKTKKLSATIQYNLLIDGKVTEKITCVEVWYCSRYLNQFGFKREHVIHKQQRDAEKIFGNAQVKEICVAFSDNFYCIVPNKIEEEFTKKLAKMDDKLFARYLMLLNRGWDQVIAKYPKVVEVLPRGNTLLPFLREYISSKQQLERLNKQKISLQKSGDKAIAKLEKDITELQRKLDTLRNRINMMLHHIVNGK